MKVNCRIQVYPIFLAASIMGLICLMPSYSVAVLHVPFSIGYVEISPDLAIHDSEQQVGFVSISSPNYRIFSGESPYDTASDGYHFCSNFDCSGVCRPLTYFYAAGCRLSSIQD